MAAWLPIRAIVLLALYLHRAGVSEWKPAAARDEPVPLAVGAAGDARAAVLLAWRWVRLLGDAPLPEDGEDAGERSRDRQAEHGQRQSPPAAPTSPVFRPDASGSLSVKYLAAAACCLFGAILVALGWQWEPIGTRKAGRVMFVEKHSPWSPSDRPYDTEILGGGDDEHSSSYNYAAAYQYLGQYYEMSRLNEGDAIDDKTLSACDVLVIKIPRVRFAPEEVQAVVNFVEAGGGLLLIGDHTNLDRSAAHMNDITRAFGFTFRDDVLYSTQPAPDEEHYQAPMVAASGDRARAGVRFRRLVLDRSGHQPGAAVVAAAGPVEHAGRLPLRQLHALCPARAGDALRLVHPGLVHARRPGTRDRLGRLDHLLELLPLPARQGPGAAEPGRVAQSPRGHGRRGGCGRCWGWRRSATDCGWSATTVRPGWCCVAAAACGWTVGSTATAALLAREMPLPVAASGPPPAAGRHRSHDLAGAAGQGA